MTAIYHETKALPVTSIPVGGKVAAKPGHVHIYRLQCSSPEKLKESIRKFFAVLSRDRHVITPTEILHYTKGSDRYGTIYCMDFIYYVHVALYGTRRPLTVPSYSLQHPTLGDLLRPVAQGVDRLPAHQLV